MAFYIHPSPKGLPAKYSTKPFVGEPRSGTNAAQTLRSLKPMALEALKERILLGTKDFSQTNLSKLNLQGLSLAGLNLKDSSFEDSDASFLKLDGSDVRGASFKNAHLAITNFNNAQLDSETDFTGASINNTVGLFADYKEGDLAVPTVLKMPRKLLSPTKKYNYALKDVNSYLISNRPQVRENTESIYNRSFLAYQLNPLLFSREGNSGIVPSQWPEMFTLKEILPAFKNHLLHAMSHIDGHDLFTNGMGDIYLLFGALNQYKLSGKEPSAKVQKYEDHLLQAYFQRLKHAASSVESLGELRNFLIAINSFEVLLMPNKHLVSAKQALESKAQAIFEEYRLDKSKYAKQLENLDGMTTKDFLVSVQKSTRIYLENLSNQRHFDGYNPLDQKAMGDFVHERLLGQDFNNSRYSKEL